MIELGVNIDHVATLRQARRGAAPDLIAAAKICEIAGAQQITVHLREDRRHIQDRDVRLLRETLLVRLNLEMAASPGIIDIAHELKPYAVCIVPERREEITTEGGLDVAGQKNKLLDLIEGMHEHDIQTSLFIDPEPAQVEAAAEIGAHAVELHTGAFAAARNEYEMLRELDRLDDCALLLADTPLAFHAGHGLNVRNLYYVAQLPDLVEVNIGHDIIARALFIGLENAVKEILAVLRDQDMMALDAVVDSP